MQCPNDEIFAQYVEGKLNGEERAEFLLHLSECPKCSTLCAMFYGHIDKSIINTCPKEESLSSLAEDKLSGKEREALLMHMAACQSCSKEYFILKKFESKKTEKRKTIKNINVLRLIAIAATFILIFYFAHFYFSIYGGNIISEGEYPILSTLPIDAPLVNKIANDRLMVLAVKLTFILLIFLYVRSF
jgi:hypothetical protein